MQFSLVPMKGREKTRKMKPEKEYQPKKKDKFKQKERHEEKRNLAYVS